MEIKLNEAELKEAIEESISNQGMDLTGKAIDIKLIAGRGDNGHYAMVSIRPEGQEADAAEVDADLPFEPDPEPEPEPEIEEPAAAASTEELPVEDQKALFAS